MEQYLYQEYDVLSSRIEKDTPSFVLDNLNQEFSLRPYQVEAFARFFDYLDKYKSKELPIHLLFNMATGSGKTLIMAGLILYLYKRGYTNFLFFVNSTNIINKTKDNFLNNLSSKYLFNQKIIFDNKQIKINEVDNFDGVNDKEINICFTTIQKLHGDLYNEKENFITIEDFEDKKIVFISDEAHHSQVSTRNGALNKEMEKPNWENTVESVFKKNQDNLLLEFTATMDFLNQAIVDKYKNKIIYKYELKEFRNDGYSKDVELLHTDTNKHDRILQAIILSQYRQDVASKNNIGLKPVVLFKAQKTIAQSEENKNLFHSIIDKLDSKDIAKIRKNTDIEILQKAFNFFSQNEVADAFLVRKLKDGFAENKCLSVNEDSEKDQHQLILNSLEDKDNQIRAIFAVQKLNEGWDVLNLFDIVRLYETRDGKNNKPGKTTISEAQLIGRGARYCPFKLKSSDDKYKRKLDKDLDNELRILEELYYHSHNESRYISEIKLALKQEGMLDENEQEVELKLKNNFKNTTFYKTGLVYANKRVDRTYDKIKSISDLGIKNKNITYKIFSGKGEETRIFAEKEIEKNKKQKTGLDIKLKDIESHIIINALARNNFFTFNSLHHYFPKITSITDFITDKEYLAGLAITFEGLKENLKNISNKDKFEAVGKLLKQIELEIKASITEYQGTETFEPSNFKEVFIDKKIKVKIDSEKHDGQQGLIFDKDWYVFNANYGTTEEKLFVELIDRHTDDLRKIAKEFYLIRNERHLKIFNFIDGQAFEPDYLLFLINKEGTGLTYQLFLEPKGEHLLEYDNWKNTFLEEIKEKFKSKVLEFSNSKKYKIIGVPFYNSENENDFKDKLFTAIKA